MKKCTCKWFFEPRLPGHLRRRWGFKLSSSSLDCVSDEISVLWIGGWGWIEALRPSDNPSVNCSTIEGTKASTACFKPGANTFWDNSRKCCATSRSSRSSMVAGRGKGFTGTGVWIWGTMGLEVAGRGKGFTGTAVLIWETVGLQVRIGLGVWGLVARNWIQVAGSG